MGKKILKILGVVLVLLVVVVAAAPFLLKGKIVDIIKNKVNENVNATFDFAEADLSLFASFPNAEVSMQGISLINKAPFEGDTLFAADKIELKLAIRELFKSAAEPIAMKSFTIEGLQVNVQVDADENASYDIAKEIGGQETTTENEPGSFTLALESYTITNATIVYDDRASGMRFELSEMQHSGTGDLSLETSELATKTEALVSFVMDSTNYLDKNKIKLDALIGIDLKESIYTFLKNEALVNQLPLVFEGFVKLNDNETQEVAISFKTPSSDFKNFLAVIPEVYSKNIENVTTTGNFMLEGKFNGIVDETHIPKFEIKINSDNASFKYPDLPKSVRNVFIDVDVINTTGITEDTYVNIDKLSFMIDDDKFNMVAKIAELMGNTKVNAHIDGSMNLANIKNAYPVPADLDLKGILNADITTAFDMASIEQKRYENTQTSGKLELRDFEYASEETPNPIKLKSTALTFNPTTVTLNELNGSTGKTDFNATGTIHNLLGFMFNNEKVEGNFDLKSTVFALNDFMVDEPVTDSGDGTTSNETNTPEEKIKIPSFLDATINASANTVLYDNLTLKDVKGSLRIKDEKATLSDMTAGLLGGRVGFGGEVSTKNDTPTFAMALALDQLQIVETFKALELFKVLAPIAGALQGKLDSNIEISGNLTDDFTPDLKSISGKVLAELFANDIDPNQAKLLSGLSSKLSFLSLDKIDLKGLKTALTFEDGVVKVKPFTINYQDLAVQIAGSHSFDSKLDYKATLAVPTKYLGSEVNALIAKINDPSLQGLTIPVTANIAGLYNSPEVSTDITSGIKSLTTQLIEIEKQKLIGKGKDKAMDLLTDVLGKNSSENDSIAQEDPSKDAIKNVIGGLLGTKQKDTVKTDSVPAKKEEDMVKEKAKDVLGGLLGKKKKKDSTN